MNSTQLEQIRLSLLRYSDSSGQYGLTPGLLLQFIRSEGFRSLTAAQLEAEIAYLADKSFLARLPKSISPENAAWRITAAGRDFLAAQTGEAL